MDSFATRQEILSPVFLLALRLYKFTFGLWPPVLAEIRLMGKVPRLQICKPTGINLPWALFVFLNFLVYGLGCVLIFLEKVYHHSARHGVQEKGLGVIIMIPSFVNLLLLGVSATVAITNRHLINVINEFIVDHLHIYIQPNKKQLDLAGLLMAYYMLGIICFILPLPFVSTFIHANAGKMIIDFYVNTFQIFVYMPNIKWITLILVFIQNAVVKYTSFKYLFLILVFPILMAGQIKQLLQTLLEENVSEARTIQNYIRIRVFIMYVREIVGYLLLCLVSWSQIFLTFLAWLSIYGNRILSTFHICGCSSAFIGGVGIAYCLCRVILSARMLSGLLIAQKRKKWFGYNSKKINYYFVVKWRAQAELPINCGEQFAMSRDTVNRYFDILNANVTNAVLLITP